MLEGDRIAGVVVMLECAGDGWGSCKERNQGIAELSITSDHRVDVTVKELPPGWARSNERYIANFVCPIHARLQSEDKGP